MVNQQREVILLMNFRVHSIRVNLHGIHNEIDPSMEFRGQVCSLKNLIGFKLFEISHCDGLILCSTKGKTRLIVWNPCTGTGETIWIKLRTSYKRIGIYALGYANINSSCQSYKILRFCSYYNEEKVRVDEFEIYDFSSDSWRVLNGLTHDWSVLSLGVSLKEHAYWIAFDKETGFFLLGFDFTIERFERFPLPYESHNREDTAVLSVVKDERLLVLYQNINEYSLVMKIWVSNKIVDTKDISWSNFLVVDFDKFILPSVSNVISFLLDEENTVAVCYDTDMVDGDRTRIYVVGEDICKEVYKRLQREQC